MSSFHLLPTLKKIHITNSNLLCTCSGMLDIKVNYCKLCVKRATETLISVHENNNSWISDIPDSINVLKVVNGLSSV